MITQRDMAEIGNSQLRRYLDELEALRLDARAVAGDLERAQLNWRPDARRWSVGQCLDHLTRTVGLYFEPIERMIEESAQRKARGERAPREMLFSSWMIRSMEPPPGMRVRTRRKVEPAAELDPGAVLAEFEESHSRLGELMRRADGVSLRHARMSSPFLGLLKFNLGQTFAVNLAHGRRHLWQARQVRQDPAFPRGDAA